MAYLGYGLQQGEGFIVITGDIGAGKTTLIGHLLGTMDRTPFHVIQIVSTAIEAADLLRVVASQLGVDTAGLEKAQLLLAIERGLHAVARNAKRTLLVVDEAQALSVGALEELRMLSNFQAGGHAMLQIVLLGQPEFRDRLNGTDSLEQLRQRIVAIHHLDAMDADEVADYIAHRLQLVGWQGRPDFTEDAFDALYAATGGVPRRLNLLAARVLLHAAITGEDLIDGDVVRTVQSDLNADMPGPAAEMLPPPQEGGALRDTAARQALPPTLAHSTADAEMTARLAELEARLEEQDAALRRVLTLLVDWVEADPANAPQLHAA
jgi:type II secretory pathway predicted ATPase ExeA